MLRSLFATLLTSLLVCLPAADAGWLIRKVSASGGGGGSGVNPGTTGLVAYWGLDEASNTTRADAHGANDLTESSGIDVGQTTGVVGNAADFNAVGGWLEDTTYPGTSGGNNPVTVNLWIKPAIIANDDGFFGHSSSEFILRVQNTDELQFILNSFSANDRVTTTTSPLSVGTWIMVTCVYEGLGGDLQIWINGTLAASATPSGTWGTVSEFRLGVWAGTNLCDAAIDECSLWDAALTEDNIVWLYNGGSGRSYADL